MADIELVIKIPEEIRLALINNIQLSQEQKSFSDSCIALAIINGTPLPKGHGRLIDVDKVISDGISKGFCDWYDEMKYAPTIIQPESEDKE